MTQSELLQYQPKDFMVPMGIFDAKKTRLDCHAYRSNSKVVCLDDKIKNFYIKIVWKFKIFFYILKGSICYHNDWIPLDCNSGSYLFDMHIHITLSVKYIVCIKKYIKVKLLQQTEYKYTKKRHICRDTRWKCGLFSPDTALQAFGIAAALLYSQNIATRKWSKITWIDKAKSEPENGLHRKTDVYFKPIKNKCSLQKFWRRFLRHPTMKCLV